MQFEPLPFVCGLAFDIEKDIEQGKKTTSGFVPARIDLGGGEELFADLRLEGFAALLELDFAKKLIIFGGDERRYKGERVKVENKLVPLNRAWAITQMLEHDFGIPAERLGFFASRSNTLGNIEAIKRQVRRKKSVVVTNHYHIPRTDIDLEAAGLNLRCRSAEAFLLLDGRLSKEVLAERLGGGPLADRMVIEINGMMEKMRGTFVSRTDAAPMPARWWNRIKIRT